MDKSLEWGFVHLKVSHDFFLYAHLWRQNLLANLSKRDLSQCQARERFSHEIARFSLEFARDSLKFARYRAWRDSLRDFSAKDDIRKNHAILLDAQILTLKICH